jgi:hypothetical protein
MSRQRLGWNQVPAEFAAAVEAALSSVIVQVDNLANGFSPGPAGPCHLADGRRVFLKACGTSLNPDTPEMLRAEAQILAGLNSSVRAPRLITVVDDGEWVGLVTELLAGHPPRIPLSADDVSAILDLVEHLADHAHQDSSARHSLPVFGQAEPRFDRLHWTEAHHLTDHLPPWVREHLEDLIRAEQSWASAAAGEHLIHGDLRSDNIVIGPTAAWAVDWSSACRGAPWVDLVALLPSLHLDGAAPPAEIFGRQRVGQSAPPAAVTTFLVHLTGYFLVSSLQPEPPGLSGLRAFQAAQGKVALNWLIERWPA